MPTETALLYCILFMTWVESSWNFYLVFRQVNNKLLSLFSTFNFSKLTLNNSLFQRYILKTTTNVPKDLIGIMPNATFSKARLYNLDSISFGIFHSLFDNILGTVSRAKSTKFNPLSK